MEKENFNDELKDEILTDAEATELVVPEKSEETVAVEDEGQSDAVAEEIDETDAADKEAPVSEKKPKPKGRVIFTLFITFFCLLIGFLSVYGFVTPDREFSENESRLLAKMPEFTLNGVLDGTFMKSFETYLTDQFPFRDEAILLKSIMERALGKREENGAYIGKDGFLFEKQTAFDGERMKVIADSINRFAQGKEALNTVFVLVPNSSFVYSEKLPDYLETENQKEQIDEFYAMLCEAIVKTDAVTPLLEAKEEHQVFYKSDHHWTTRGAFVVFEKIMEGFGEEFNEQEFEFHTVSNSFEGTLKSKSPAQAARDTVEVCFPKNSQGTYFAEFSGEGNKKESLFFKEKLSEKNHYKVFLGSNVAKVSVSTVLEGDRKLLVIKDSFANCLIPMLTPYFSKIVVIDPRYMTEGIDGIMNEDAFTDVLFLYNANTFFSDSVLTDVLGRNLI